MANLMKMYFLSLFHFHQMPGTVTFGTNTDNDSLATFIAKWHYQLADVSSSLAPATNKTSENNGFRGFSIL